MCGVVDGGIVPGLWGYEAGQSGVGDIFGWFVDNAVPPRYHEEAARRGLDVHDHLSELAGEQEVGEHGLVALDWNNGNRSVLVDHELSGLIVGLTLATRAEDVYRALIEATAFGTRMILETFATAGLPVTRAVRRRRAAQEPGDHADLRRRHADAAAPDRLRAGPGARLGDARGGRRRRVPGHLRRGGRDGQASRATPTCPTRRRADAYDALYEHYAQRCTTTSAAAATTSCTRCATSARARWPVADELAELRREVCALHAELPRNGLVAWTSGNLSARVPGEELMVIKASGVPYDELTPDAIVVCDLHGGLVEGDLVALRRTPPPTATSTASSTDVGGVAHTHSAYATAWAVRGEPIPCVLTAMADEFGGEIPIGPFALIGDEEIGRGVVDTLAGHRSPAVLMRSHGVFTLGPGPRDAIKAAVMCEDVARTVHLARVLGDPIPLAREDIDALYDRYQNVYGQR